MRNTLFLLLIIFSATGGRAMAAEPAGNPVSGERATASEYSVGADMLHGEVLAISGRQISVRDATTGEPVTVIVTDELLLNNIEPGDQVHIGFARDGKTAAQVTKSSR